MGRGRETVARRCRYRPSFGLGTKSPMNGPHARYPSRQGGSQVVFNPSTAVEHFYAGLAKLTPLEWLSTILDHDILEYQRASDPGREVIAEFARSPNPTDAESALLLIQETAAEVVTDLWPDLATLRADMRPYKAPGATDLSEEAYDMLLKQVTRQVHLAGAGVALAEHLTPAQLSGLYQPFEELVPLSTVLNAPRDFERDLALAFLVSSRWAAQHGPGSPAVNLAFWKATAPRWLSLLTGAGSGHIGVGVPNFPITMGLATAASAFLSDGGAKPYRYKVLPLMRETELRVSGSVAQIRAHLAEFRYWQMVRYERRWVARHLARIMEAILWRELPDGTRMVQPGAKSLAIIGQALEAMGFEPADIEPPPPPGGVLALPATLAWWKPVPLDLSQTSLSLGGASQTGGRALPPPEAHHLNTTLVAEPSHFETALAWYETAVLPFIDDYAPAPTQTSRFSSAVPYKDQPDEVRLLLWALADAMLVAAQAQQEVVKESAAMHLRRLPLIRSIWWEEVHAAARSVLGLGPEDDEPELSDPRFLDYFNRVSDARERIEAAMLRFLKFSPDADELPSDRLSAVQIAMAARAAIPLTGRVRTTRMGCAGTVLLIGAAGAAIAQTVAFLAHGM